LFEIKAYALSRRHHFFCRICSGVTYERTHSGDFDRLARMIRNKRVKIFGKKLISEIELPLTESSQWEDKPKYKHNRKFYEDVSKLAEIEERLKSLIERSC
jgi:hypothetical protein